MRDQVRTWDAESHRAELRRITANVESATDQEILSMVRRPPLDRDYNPTGYCDTQPLEREVLRRIRERLPGFEHGKIERYDFEVPRRDQNGKQWLETEYHPAVYVRWQNGPDLYEIVERFWAGDSHFMNDHYRRYMLCRVLDRWTKIRKKARGEAPREPLDVPAFLASNRGTDGCLWHAVQRWKDSGNQRYLDMIEREPEKAEDILRYYAKNDPYGLLYY